MARCKEVVCGDWHNHQCSRNATVDGYCRQHHPDAVQARREASRARAEETPIRRLMNSNAKLKALLAEALPYVNSRHLMFGTSMGKTKHIPTDEVYEIKKDLTRRIKEAIK